MNKYAPFSQELRKGLVINAELGEEPDRVDRLLLPQPSPARHRPGALGRRGEAPPFPRGSGREARPAAGERRTVLGWKSPASGERPGKEEVGRWADGEGGGHR